MASHSESFTGTNGDPVPGWTNLNGSLVIQSNRAAGGTSGNTNNAIYTDQGFGYDQYAQTTLTTLTASSGVLLRWQNGASHNGYLLRGNATSTYLDRYSGGGATNLVNFSQACSSGDTLRIEAVGTTLRCYRNGSQIGSDVTDGTYQTGYTGLWMFGNTNRQDDWEGGDYNPSGLTDDADALFDFETGADGNNVTVTVARAAVNPTPAWGTISLSRTPLQGTSIEADAEHDLGGTFTVGKVEYDDTGASFGMRVDFSVGAEYILYVFPTGSHPKVSVGFWFKTDIPYSNGIGHSMISLASNGTEYAVFYLNTDDLGYLPIGLEVIGGLNGTDIHAAINTWYWVTLLYDATAEEAKLEVYDEAGSQVGTTLTSALIASPPNCSRIFIGHAADHGDTPAATIDYDDVVIDWTDGTFPLFPVAAGGATTNPWYCYAQQ